ncbi:MAG: hypothetical protein WAV79_05305, partial [Anaerolineae bacterium]
FCRRKQAQFVPACSIVQHSFGQSMADAHRALACGRRRLSRCVLSVPARGDVFGDERRIVPDTQQQSQ